jgi:hypothetical protein
MKKRRLLHVREFAVVEMNVLPVMTIMMKHHHAVHKAHGIGKNQIQEKESVVLIPGVLLALPAQAMKMRIGVLLPKQLMIGEVPTLKMS